MTYSNNRPGQQRGTEAKRFVPNALRRSAPPPADISPLERLRQIAGDIKRAIGSGNWPLVAQAASLLAPVLEAEKKKRREMGDKRQETRREEAEILVLLNDCEQRITMAMKQTSDEMRQLRQSKRRIGTLAVVRQRDSAVSCRLDTNR